MNTKTLNSIWLWLLPVAYVAAVVVNGIANYLPLNGINTGQVSDSTGSLFAPAPYIFSIWGLIYTMLLLHVVYQFMHRDDSRLQTMRWPLILNLLLNAAWMFAWHFQVFGLSVVIMLCILFTLLVLFVQRPITNGYSEWFFIRFPVELYLGWISVATIANVSAWLSVIEWGVFGIAADAWTAIMTAVAVVLGMIMIWREHSYVFGAVVAWASIGLYTKYFTNDMIAMVAFVAPIILVLTMLVRWFSDKRLIEGARKRS